jgi:cellulose synthase/poly-beta-1,6-N-acetylglucosamine synthase-like glycosyltransferase
MNLIHILYFLLQILLFAGIGLPVLYIFIYSVAGLFYRQHAYPEQPPLSRIAVLIPGYKEDEVIREVAEDALLQDYPRAYYDVIVIADSFQKNTLDYLRTLRIKVIEVSFEKSTKSKALNKAMEQLPDHYDIAVVLDADNLMARDFLSRINASFANGYSAIQGHRTAKNTDTSLAILDAASEEINNHIFRKGHRALGLSSAIIGSGMAFSYAWFKNVMLTVTATGGFDKELELKILKEGKAIEYLDDAVVYDEKVQKAEVFTSQRRRWISAQFIYFSRDFFSSLKALLARGNVDYFDKTIQFIQPPRILLLGMAVVMGLLFSVLNRILGFNLIWNYIWIGVVLACAAALLFALPRKMYSIKTLKALASLPRGMVLMAGSLLKIKDANKQFLHTQHSAKSSSES